MKAGSTPCRRRTIKRGFTLVELLVVVAVIAIFAGLLLPALASAKSKAKAVGCINNVRQLGLSFQLFVSDHGIPNYELPDQPGAEGLDVGSYWFGVLGPYYRNTNVLLCPTTKVDPSRTNLNRIQGSADTAYRWPYVSSRIINPNTGRITRTSVVAYGSYAFNGWLNPRWGGEQEVWLKPHYYRKEEEVGHPSQTPVFADGQAADFTPFAEYFPPTDLYYVDDLPFASLGHVAIGRHGAGGTLRKSTPIVRGQSLGPYVNHIAFFDGHVEKVKLDHLWQLYWHKHWTPLASRPN